MRTKSGLFQHCATGNLDQNSNPIQFDEIVLAKETRRNTEALNIEGHVILPSVAEQSLS